MTQIIYERTGDPKLDSALRRMQNRMQGTENVVNYNVAAHGALEARVRALEATVAAILAANQASGGGS
jgi:hypothetical protein